MQTAWTRYRDSREGRTVLDTGLGDVIRPMSDPNYGLNIDHSRYGQREAPPIHDYEISELEPYSREVDAEDRKGDAFVADLFIIGQSAYEPVRFLTALVVKWEDGVAYRIGFALVAERDWVKLTNREWKRIILG
jgi:hypothetical protein